METRLLRTRPSTTSTAEHIATAIEEWIVAAGVLAIEAFYRARDFFANSLRPTPRPTTPASSLEMDPPFGADRELLEIVEDDEPTIIDHFISPSARVIDQRRK